MAVIFYVKLNVFTVHINLLQIIVLENKKKVFSLPVSYEPSCVAINPDKTFVAVGGAGDNTVNTQFSQITFLWGI